MIKGILIFIFGFVLNNLYGQNIVSFGSNNVGNQVLLPVLCEEKDSVYFDFSILIGRQKIVINEIEASKYFSFLLNSKPINLNGQVVLNKKDDLKMIYTGDIDNRQIKMVNFKLTVDGKSKEYPFLAKNYQMIIEPEIIMNVDTLLLQANKCGFEPLIIFKNEGTITSAEIKFNDSLIFEDSGYRDELLEFNFSDQEYGIYEVTYMTHDNRYCFVIEYEE